MSDPTLLDLIPPSRIRARLPFTGTFRRAEAEHAAAWLVIFAQEHSPSRWEPIPVDAFVEWLSAPARARYASNPFIDLPRGFHLLGSDGFVARVDDRFEVTGAFALRCFLSGHDLIAPLRAVARAMSASPEFVRAHLERLGG